MIPLSNELVKAPAVRACCLRRPGLGLALVVAVCVSACAAPGRTTEPEPTFPISDFEEFDPSPYPSNAPVDSVRVEHDVPDVLLNSRPRPDVQSARTSAGFRIQIISTDDKRAADSALEAANSWWGTYRRDPGVPAALFPDNLPVYIAYNQPYYRVRIGNFTDREAAEQALRYVQQRFPGAWVVPDTVMME